MRQDKEKVFSLRREGKSYREIQKEINISRDTLSRWFKNEDWSHHIKKSNNTRNIQLSSERIKKLFEARKLIWDAKYKTTEEEAKREFEIYKNNSLFTAGLMIYAGEGDKPTKSQIRLANTDFNIHRVFLKFIQEFTKTKPEKIKISILLYPDLDIEKCRNKWANELGISLNNFYKPQVILGRHKTKRLHFGVGSIIICDSFLKRKLLLWIEMGKSFLLK